MDAEDLIPGGPSIPRDPTVLPETNDDIIPGGPSIPRDEKLIMPKMTGELRRLLAKCGLEIQEDKTDDHQKDPLTRLDEIGEIEKWTGCLIQGNRLSKAWTERLCLQTSGFDLFTNSQLLLKEYYDALAIPYDSNGNTYSRDFRCHAKDYKDAQKLNKACGVMKDIRYLSNSCICSASLGNQNWVQWDGSIKKCGNLGKYPTARNIYDEWCVIAKRFPILNIICQLLDGELSYDNLDELNPIVQFNIHDGKVDIQFNDIKKLDLKHSNVYDDILSSLSGDTYHKECLIRPTELKDVVERVKQWHKM